MSVLEQFVHLANDRQECRVSIDYLCFDDGRELVSFNFDKRIDTEEECEARGYVRVELCDKTGGVTVTAFNPDGNVIHENFISFADLVGSQVKSSSKYVAYNHNHTELGSFDTRARAQSEADYYRQLTGNAAYVEMVNA